MTSGAALAADPCPPAAISVATTPVPMQYVSKMEMHHELMKRLDQPAEVVLFGDSLVEGWDSRLPPLDHYKVVNLGLGADATQNTLWRLQQIRSNKLDPRIVIMTLGTNNLGQGDPACGIAEGVRQVLDGTHALWPAAKILFIGIPPRGSDLQFRNDVRMAANDEIRRFTDANPWVEYIDIDGPISCGFAGNLGLFDWLIGWAFSPAWRCGNFRADAVHFSGKGYAVLSQILGGQRTH